MNSSDNRSPQQTIWSLGDQLDSDIWRLPCLLFLWVEKCLFHGEILSARGKMDPMPVRSSAWSEGSQWMS